MTSGGIKQLSFDMRLEHEVIQSHKLWLCIILFV
uniref:Uncharacterized protein n=1 Tax=Siphoviridae sp. ctDmQ3 TaxID=2823570 RepID=A0A8S5L822_9CAUD|nr:MAG TPA: hypothetical protein [Siphoviridae sp. ctDmQ3]